MNNMVIDLGGGNSLVADAGAAAIYFADGTWKEFDVDSLGNVAEWLAVAWENVAGEEYRPVIITERGYVAQGSVLIEDAAQIASRIDHTVRVKKRGVTMPGLDRLEEMSGNSESAIRARLERDCE